MNVERPFHLGWCGSDVKGGTMKGDDEMEMRRGVCSSELKR